MKVKFGFSLYLKVIKERSIGGEDIVAFQQRRRKKCERENFGKEDGGALTQKENPKLQRRETGDFSEGTPYNNKLPWEPFHLIGFSQ